MPRVSKEQALSSEVASLIRSLKSIPQKDWAEYLIGYLSARDENE